MKEHPVPSDPENTTLIGYLAAALFGGGGAAKLITHEGRIASLEKTKSHHAEKLEEIGASVAVISDRSERAEKDRATIMAKLDTLLSKHP